MFIATGSIMYDAIYVPGGQQSIETLKQEGDAIHFINEAFRHCKAIAATGEGVELLKASSIQGVNLLESDSNGQVQSEKGVVTLAGGSDMHSAAEAFIQAIAQHRHWVREQKEKVPA
jgi:catalase